MEKIKILQCMWSGVEFRLMFLLFAIITAVLFGVQCLAFWVGGLFPSVDNLGLEITATLGTLLVIPVIAIVAQEGKFEGAGNMILTMLILVSIYVSVVWSFNWWVLVICITMLLFNLWKLDKVEMDWFFAHGIPCTCLLYCIGAYFAMSLYGIEVATNFYGIVAILMVALFVWFKSAFKIKPCV